MAARLKAKRFVRVINLSALEGVAGGEDEYAGDTGGSTQTYDDGSTLTTGSDGTYSSTPATDYGYAGGGSTQTYDDGSTFTSGPNGYSSTPATDYGFGGEPQALATRGLGDLGPGAVGDGSTPTFGVGNDGVQRFDDGTTLQRFDDGSAVARDTDGNFTSSPATDTLGSTIANRDAEQDPFRANMTAFETARDQLTTLRGQFDEAMRTSDIAGAQRLMGEIGPAYDAAKLAANRLPGVFGPLNSQMLDGPIVPRDTLAPPNQGTIRNLPQGSHMVDPTASYYAQFMDGVRHGNGVLNPTFASGAGHVVGSLTGYTGGGDLGRDINRYQEGTGGLGSVALSTLGVIPGVGRLGMVDDAARGLGVVGRSGLADDALRALPAPEPPAGLLTGPSYLNPFGTRGPTSGALPDFVVSPGGTVLPTSRSQLESGLETAINSGVPGFGAYGTSRHGGTIFEVPKEVPGGSSANYFMRVEPGVDGFPPRAIFTEGLESRNYVTPFGGQFFGVPREVRREGGHLRLGP